MGWIITKEKNLATNKSKLDDLFNSPSESEVTKSAIVNNVYYAAVKDLHTTLVSAVVCLIKNNNDGTSASYKVIYEDEGPLVNNCPKEIIEALSPTNNKLANKWRDKCKKQYQGLCK